MPYSFTLIGRFVFFAGFLGNPFSSKFYRSCGDKKSDFHVVLCFLVLKKINGNNCHRQFIISRCSSILFALLFLL